MQQNGWKYVDEAKRQIYSATKKNPKQSKFEKKKSKFPKKSSSEPCKPSIPEVSMHPKDQNFVKSCTKVAVTSVEEKMNGQLKNDKLEKFISSEPNGI